MLAFMVGWECVRLGTASLHVVYVSYLYLVFTEGPFGNS